MNRRITDKQERLLTSFAAHDLGWLTVAEVAAWARGETIAPDRAARARLACEKLGIEAVWL